MERTWPASVPVMDEFCPHANSTRAAVLPSAGASSSYASARPAMSGLADAP